MGTHAVIRVEGFDGVELYKHWDGYPSATLPWLEKFNSEFTKNRGDDVNYKFAQLIRSSVYMGTEFELDGSLYTGWGVMIQGESCCDYMYILKKDGTVEVQDAP
jgi:hypothetical protein